MSISDPDTVRLLLNYSRTKWFEALETGVVGLFKSLRSGFRDLSNLVPSVFGFVANISFFLVTCLVLAASCGEQPQERKVATAYQNSPSSGSSGFSKIQDITIPEDTPVVLKFQYSSEDEKIECSAKFFSYQSSNSTVAGSDNSFGISGKYPNCEAKITPNLNANGKTNIALVFTESSQKYSTKFQLIVTPENDAPIPANSTKQSIEVPKDASTELKLTVASDVDSTQENLSYVLVTKPVLGTLAELPSVPLSGEGAVSYSPNAGAKGTDKIVYKICDDAKPSACSEELTIEIAFEGPSGDVKVSKIDPQTTPEDTPIAVKVTLSSEDESLSCTATNLGYSSSNPLIVPTEGAVTWSGTWPNCVATITAERNANGVVGITINVINGSFGTNTGFDLTVSSVNDSPLVVNSGDTMITAVPNNVSSILLSSATDVDNEQSDLNYVIVTMPTKGVLGTKPNVPASGTASYNYTPNTGATGSDSLVYKICDNETTPACTSDLTVNITI